MSFSHFDMYGRSWERAAEELEERLRQAAGDRPPDPDAEMPEAEIDDAERGAAVARERARRWRRRRS